MTVNGVYKKERNKRGIKKRKEGHGGDAVNSTRRNTWFRPLSPRLLLTLFPTFTHQTRAIPTSYSGNPRNMTPNIKDTESIENQELFIYFLNKYALRLVVVFCIQKHILDMSIGSLGYAIDTRPLTIHTLSLSQNNQVTSSIVLLGGWQRIRNRSRGRRHNKRFLGFPIKYQRIHRRIR